MSLLRIRSKFEYSSTLHIIFPKFQKNFPFFCLTSGLYYIALINILQTKWEGFFFFFRFFRRCACLVQFLVLYYAIYYTWAPVAQLDRASASGVEGRGFESRRVYHFKNPCKKYQSGLCK